MLSSTTTSNNNSTTSVSNEEVSKFSDMHKDWWDPQFHPLIAMNPVRINYILDLVKRHRQPQQEPSDSNGHSPPLQGLKALDVGCGGGLLSESLARLGAQVTAVDPSRALVEMAQEHARQTGDPRLQTIDYRGGISVEELAQELLSDDNKTEKDPKFDIVCCLEVLEHVTNVPSLVQAASSLVKQTSNNSKSSGLLFVSTINRTWKSHLLTIVGAEYVMGYVPRGTHNWDQYLAPREVTLIAEESGNMTPVDISGMVLTRPPVCGHWDWKIDPTDTDVNWIGAYRPK